MPTHEEKTVLPTKLGGGPHGLGKYCSLFIYTINVADELQVILMIDR